jgi:probable rRNA maturation factor
LKLALIYTDSFPKHIIKKGILRKKIRLLSKAISSKESVDFGEIEIVCLDAAEIKSYNKLHLGHDYETDIITFDLTESKLTEGQLLISWENVLHNSRRFKTDFETELLRVIIHGLLHLSGFDDRNAKQKRIMRLKENEYLKLYENAGKSN